MNRPSQSFLLIALFLGAMAVFQPGCTIRPMASLQKSQDTASDALQFYGPCWADSSGKDGKGGVSIVCSGDKHLFLQRNDPCNQKIDAATLSDHPNWIVYNSDTSSGACLSFEFTWITTLNDKFWGKKWAGGGLAFDGSWSTHDFSGAKYIVLYAKTNVPGVDFNLSLSGSKDSSYTGTVKISDFATGHKIGTDWTQVIIPISSLPGLSKMDMTQAKIMRFDLAGDYPDNKPVYIRLDKTLPHRRQDGDSSLQPGLARGQEQHLPGLGQIRRGGSQPLPAEGGRQERGGSGREGTYRQTAPFPIRGPGSA